MPWEKKVGSICWCSQKYSEVHEQIQQKIILLVLKDIREFLGGKLTVADNSCSRTQYEIGSSTLISARLGTKRREEVKETDYITSQI